jgi:hypothetical protein
MSLMMMLTIAWAVLTAILIILLIYRSTLTMHEDDAMFLDDADSHLRIEQEQLQVKMKKIAPLVKISGALSGILIIAIAALAIWEKINSNF